MSFPVHELEAAVLALPVQERARLARRLLSSLDEEEQEVQDAWVAEVRERLAQYRAGEVEALPVEEVMREARKSARAP